MRKKIKKIEYVKPLLEPLSGPSAVHASIATGSSVTQSSQQGSIQWGCVGGPSAGTCPGGPSATGVCGPGGSTALDQGIFSGTMSAETSGQYGTTQ